MLDQNAYPVTMEELLQIAVERKASDLHLTPGAPPILRIDQSLSRMDYPSLGQQEVRNLLLQILKPQQIKALEKDLELDFSYSIESLARFRGNVMYQRGSLAVAVRVVPYQVPELDQLGLPPVVKELCYLSRGLVLVTGPTGSGKSTTLASMIDLINRERSVNIVTVEDPIEFLHTHKKATVKQREVGMDTHSFANALRHVLRHDPDVLLIGEMRDLESISIALTAAETGHLVLSTLHTQTAPLTIHRIVDVFAEHQRNQIRQQLAGSLQAVISQQLLPNIKGDGLVLAVEYLGTNPAVKNIIREGKEHQLYSLMQSSQASSMATMDMSLSSLCAAGKISRKVAMEHCIDRNEMERIFRQYEAGFSRPSIGY
jgi:twitching motility protein PilT